MAQKAPLRIGDFWKKFSDYNKDLFKDRLVGLEVEVEHAPGFNLQDPLTANKPTIDANGYWAVVQDHSLRNNGAEFVSIPFPVSYLKEALHSLFVDIKGKKQWKPSIRTGIHVHNDARDYTEESLRSFMVANCLVEPVLMDFVGKEREENIYCVPWYRSHNDLNNAITNLEYTHCNFLQKVEMFTAHWQKYDSVNLNPLLRIGTIEFRHAPTWFDTEKITTWAQTCSHIVSYCKGKAPDQLLTHFENAPDDFLSALTPHLPYPSFKYEKMIKNLGCDLLAQKVIPLNLNIEEGWVRSSDEDWESPKVPENKKISPLKGYYPDGLVQAYTNTFTWNSSGNLVKNPISKFKVKTVTPGFSAWPPEDFGENEST